MRNAPLTVTLYVGDKQVDTLTEEHRQRLADRLSEVMSRYYTVHPDEYRILVENDRKKNGEKRDDISNG